MDKHTDFRKILLIEEKENTKLEFFAGNFYDKNRKLKYIRN